MIYFLNTTVAFQVNNIDASQTNNSPILLLKNDLFPFSMEKKKKNKIVLRYFVSLSVTVDIIDVHTPKILDSKSYSMLSDLRHEFNMTQNSDRIPFESKFYLKGQ